MKNKLIKTGVLAAMAACMIATTSCQKEEMNLAKPDPAAATERPGPGISNYIGKIDVRLTDIGKANFGGIALTFSGLALHYKDERVGKGGWVFLPTKPHLTDVLMYQQGASFSLGSSRTLPMGIIDNIRIVLGEPNYVVWGDSDVKHKADLVLNKRAHLVDVNLHLPVDLHRTMTVVLGFNADKSITHLEDDTYQLMPDIFLEHIRYTVTSPVEQNPDPISN